MVRGSELESKGRASAKRLSGGQRKAFHLGQFFTSVGLASLLHRWAGLDQMPRLSIIDNSAGSGRLLDGLSQHRRVAIEIDADAVNVLREKAKSDPGLEVVHGDFFNIRAQQFSLAIINPPFNLTVDSRHGRALGVGLSGIYGDGTRFNTTYAGVAHALQAAGVVLAILPRGSLRQGAEGCAHHDAFLAAYGGRLRAVFPLPEKSFAEEGTDVATELAVFLPGEHEAEHFDATLDGNAGGSMRDEVRKALHGLSGLRGTVHEQGLPRRLVGLPKSGPGAVRLTRKGRRLIIQPDSIQTYSRALDVLTGALVGEQDAHGWEYSRRPRPYGLDLQAFLAQADPLAALHHAFDALRTSGLAVTVDPGLLNWFRHEVRRTVVERAPFRRWAHVSGHRQRVLFFQSQLRVAVTNTVAYEDVEPGTSCELVRQDKTALFSVYEEGRATGTVVTNALAALHFDATWLPSNDAPTEWRLIYPGLETISPERWAAWSARARALNIDGNVYGFALRDLIEMAARRGGIYHAGMSLAKTRFGLMLARLIGAKHALIVTRAKDVRTWADEYRQIGSPLGAINEITTATGANRLARLNIISVDLLRQRALPRRARCSFADVLSGRCAVVISDEAHYFSNTTSQRSRAAGLLKPKRFYLLTGSAVKGRARHVFNLCRLGGGEHTARQPYGHARRPKMTAKLLHSVHGALPGPAAFVEDFLSAQSFSGEMLATLGRGRVVNEEARVKNPVAFREYLAPLILRRRHDEPEVRACVCLPDPEIETRYFTPCEQQVAIYGAQLGSYMEWLREFLAAQPLPNLEVAKHRMSGLYWAASFPQHLGGFGSRLTTAQQALLRDAREHLAARAGMLVIVTQSPEYATFLAEQLRSECATLTLLTSETDARSRSHIVLDHFHDGESELLVTTFGVIAESYNLPKVATMFLAGASWEPHVLQQTVRRMCRPQQTRTPVARVYLTRGTLQEHQYNYCARKQAAIDESVDFEDYTVTEEASLWKVFELLRKDYESLGVTAATRKSFAQREQIA